MITGPDVTVETFVQNHTEVTLANVGSKPGAIEVVFIENYYDPDPTDQHYDGTMIYLIREDGRLRVEEDRHTLGLFPLRVWRDLLDSVGFTVYETEVWIAGRKHMTFTCLKPLPVL